MSAPQSAYSGAPFWQAGIQGQNQIVAVGDTGVDLNLCFFYDPKASVPYNKFSNDHRKIAYYYAFQDNWDVVGGHGSHVAGSIAGSVLDGVFDSNKDFNGMAPAAKLAVIDIMDNRGGLKIPDNLYHDYFGKVYAGGVRIMSSSWGILSNDYNTMAHEVDLFAYDHPDFLPVFAAGNYGENGYWSIAVPGLAKNSLAVASHRNLWQSWNLVGFLIIKLQMVIATVTAADGFGPSFRTLSPSRNYQAIFAVPNDACGALTNADDVAGKIVLVLRGTCSFQSKAARVSAVNAIAILIVDLSGSGAVMSKKPEEAASRIPAALITFSDWKRFSNLFDGYSGLIDIVAAVPAASDAFGINSMSSFSSRGPTKDGRFKPDIAAAGEMIRSAKSGGIGSLPNWCDASSTHSMSGTSMATPITAGTAALVRQYFVEGFYQGGYRNLSAGINPSGALMKAVFINSGIALSGNVADKSTNLIVHVPEAIPSVFYGFGRVQLDTTLPLSNWSDFTLWFDDIAGVRPKRNSIRDGTKNLYCFSIKDTLKPFKVTLVWTDPPASPLSNRQLINNLDLVVALGLNGTVLFGNQMDYNATSLDVSQHTHPLHVKDELNNVEQVTWMQNGSFPLLATVSVQGFHVPMGPQTYALVVTGNFEEVPVSACPSSEHLCPNNCGAAYNTGKCVDGICVCNSFFTGADCSISSVELLLISPNNEPSSVGNHEGSFLSKKFVGYVGVFGWSYYHVEIKNMTSQPLDSRQLVFTVDTTSKMGDPDIFVAANSFPSLSHYDLADTLCDTCLSSRGGSRHHVLTFSNASDGFYIIGIYGYCCDPSSYQISATFGLIPYDSKSSAWEIAIVVIGGFIFLALLALGVYFYFRTPTHEFQPVVEMEEFSIENHSNPNLTVSVSSLTLLEQKESSQTPPTVESVPNVATFSAAVEIEHMQPASSSGYVPILENEPAN